MSNFEVYEPVNLYLDVDGVFADFETYWNQRLIDMGFSRGLEAEDPSRDLYRKEVAENSLFTNLGMTKNGRFLRDRIQVLQEKYPELRVEMLTASGLSEANHVINCRNQKKIWLDRFGFSQWNYNVVGRKSEKQAFVKSSRDIIIDDSEKTCKAWAGNGGTSVIYTDSYDVALFTVSFIESIILAFRAEKEFKLYV